MKKKKKKTQKKEKTEKKCTHKHVYKHAQLQTFDQQSWSSSDRQLLVPPTTASCLNEFPRKARIHTHPDINALAEFVLFKRIPRRMFTLAMKL